MGTARQTQLQVTHKEQLAFTYATINGVAAQVERQLPQGSILLRATLYITTAFNAGTTNTLNVGFTANGTDLFNAQAAGTVAVASATMTVANSVTGFAAADTGVFIQYNQTGVAATAGAGYLVLEYAPPN
jgi:hypothetical protein